MISELNNSHTYIAGGDWVAPPRPQVALPGARFALDAASGRYKLSHIFKGQNEEDRYRSPLTEIGIDVKEGDYVLAINGEELDRRRRSLQAAAQQGRPPGQLTVNDRPALEGLAQNRLSSPSLRSSRWSTWAGSRATRKSWTS